MFAITGCYPEITETISSIERFWIICLNNGTDIKPKNGSMSF